MPRENQARLIEKDRPPGKYQLGGMVPSKPTRIVSNRKPPRNSASLPIGTSTDNDETAKLPGADAEQRSLPSTRRFARLGLMGIVCSGLIRLQIQVRVKKAYQIDAEHHAGQLFEEDSCSRRVNGDP